MILGIIKPTAGFSFVVPLVSALCSVSAFICYIIYRKKCTKNFATLSQKIKIQALNKKLSSYKLSPLTCQEEQSMKSASNRFTPSYTSKLRIACIIAFAISMFFSLMVMFS